VIAGLLSRNQEGVDTRRNASEERVRPGRRGVCRLQTGNFDKISRLEGVSVSPPGWTLIIRAERGGLALTIHDQTV
jgi:hypothetical protein